VSKKNLKNKREREMKNSTEKEEELKREEGGYGRWMKIR